MLHEIGLELQAALRARGCPLVVVDGPEDTKAATYGRERIVIEYDFDRGDSFGPVRSQRANPKHRFVSDEGAKITIYTQSTKPGAQPFEQRRRAKHVRDLVLIALDEVARTRRNVLTLAGGRFVRPEALEGTERDSAGAVYELTFSVDRAVHEQRWDGSIAGEWTVTAGSIASTTKVSALGGPDDDDNPQTPPATAETACG